MNGDEIAIIGIDCRFPQAESVEQFWNNLVGGKESIEFLTEEDLKAVPAALKQHKDYVPSQGGAMPNQDQFDAAFFGYSPKEAQLMDPQMRLLHQGVWNVLEDAGYVPDTYRGNIGLYVGLTDNIHWQNNVLFSPERNMRDNLAVSQLLNKDHAATRVSYNLGLSGPSFNLNTACSTSLVAVHLACQGILNGETSIGIAGGVSINHITNHGYVYREGSVLSNDGHCRAFDEQAKGTVHGSGMGFVALKLLDDAIEDGDNIYAVIKGSAINNDGNKKVGYTSPSVDGQVSVIKAAMEVSEVEPQSISYVEAHGTATPLGDPIEVEALRAAYGKLPENNVGIGTVKSNIGHLDVAAGVAGLIKTSLALQNQILPPTLHYQKPNPKLGLEGSPFYVVDEAKSWEARKGIRRAGVSSFGIGGTNAHVVVEAFDPSMAELPATKERLVNAFNLSAKSPVSLTGNAQRLTKYLQANPDVSLTDLAFTLRNHRKSFDLRKSIIATNRTELLEGLAQLDPENLAKAKDRKVVFMFSGQGSQFAGMTQELYDTYVAFRAVMDEGFELFRQETGEDLKAIVFGGDAEAINQTQYSQPMLFILEYALAKLLNTEGIVPDITIGHSIGEYVAACLARVFSFADGLKMVMKRGQLMQRMEPGYMLSMNISRAQLNNQIMAGVDLSVINAPNNHVISGPREVILAKEKMVKGMGIHCSVLKTSHAFHSVMMEPMLAEYEGFLEQFELSKPMGAFMSNVSGKQITPEQAMSPSYWASHVRQAVDFSGGISELMKRFGSIMFVEVGPGRALTALAQKINGQNPSNVFLNTVRHIQEKTSDVLKLQTAVGKIWEQTRNERIEAPIKGAEYRRLRIPTYAFENKRYNATLKYASIDELLKDQVQVQAPREAIADNLYHLPFWRQYNPMKEIAKGKCLVFVETIDQDQAIVDFLKAAYEQVTVVEKGDAYVAISAEHYQVPTNDKEAFRSLVKGLRSNNVLPESIYYFWPILSNGKVTDRLHKAEVDFYPLTYLVQEIGAQGLTEKIRLKVITGDTLKVAWESCIYPENALTIGLTKMISLEYPNVQAQAIDLNQEQFTQQPQRVLSALVSLGLGEKKLALRGDNFWVQRYDAVASEAISEQTNQFVKGGKYLITGGSGGMGLFIAKMLVDKYQAKVLLLSRSTPQQILERTTDEEKVKKPMIEYLLGKQEQVQFQVADVADFTSLDSAIQTYEDKYGKLNGVLHAAGVIDNKGMIQKRTKSDFETSFAPKLQGTLNLLKAFEEAELDFMCFFSSSGTITYQNKYGETGYVASNEFLDTLSDFNYGKTPLKTINWCDWSGVGLSMKAIDNFFAHDVQMKQQIMEEFDRSAVSPEEGTAILDLIMKNDARRVALCKSPLDEHAAVEGLAHKLEILNNGGDKVKGKDLSGKIEVVKNLNKKPLPEIQRYILQIWKEYFGFNTINVKDNVFEMGANSLDIAQINESYKTFLGIDIPLVTLFEYPSIEKLSQFIKGDEELQEEKIPVTTAKAKNRMNKMRAMSKKD